MTDPTQNELQVIWKKYKETNSNELKDKLIINYSPLVKFVASRISASLPPNIEMADLISYGIFGLIDAVEKFEIDREIKFETYAISRIRGAIVDELRSMDWVPRSVRQMGRELEKAYQDLQTRHKRAPSDQEIADELDVPLEKLHELYDKLSSSSMIALEEMKVYDGPSDDKLALIDMIEERGISDPLEIFELNEMQGVLSEAIKNLPERERIIVNLYYYEGLTLREIGEVLGLTESRVSQLRTKATVGLKSALKSFKF